MAPGNTRARCIFITTPEGVNLPAAALEKNFLLLVRLNKNLFNFSQARPRGEDIRFIARNLLLAQSAETGVWPDIWESKEVIFSDHLLMIVGLTQQQRSKDKK